MHGGTIKVQVRLATWHISKDLLTSGFVLRMTVDWDFPNIVPL